MTPRQFFVWATRDPWVVVAVFAALPFLSVLLGLVARGRGNDRPWKYVYSVLVYVACVPGMLGLMTTAYVLLFTRENLLDMNMLVTLAPAASMALTLLIASRNVRFRPLPGFGRLSGLILMITLTFLIVFALSRTRVWLFFGGSMLMLLGVALVVFLLLTWGARLAFGRRRDNRA